VALHDGADWTRYIALLASGLTPKQIERLPGHPYAGSFYLKRRADSEFAARVAKVYTPGPSGKPHSVDWEGYIILLSQGLKPKQIEGMKGQPCAKSFRQKRINDPDFAARVAEVYKPKQRGMPHQKRMGQKRVPKTEHRRRAL
jgi:hypothetical protein